MLVSWITRMLANKDSWNQKPKKALNQGKKQLNKNISKNPLLQ